MWRDKHRRGLAGRFGNRLRVGGVILSAIMVLGMSAVAFSCGNVLPSTHHADMPQHHSTSVLLCKVSCHLLLTSSCDGPGLSIAFLLPEDSTTARWLVAGLATDRHASARASRGPPR